MMTILQLFRRCKVNQKRIYQPHLMIALVASVILFIVPATFAVDNMLMDPDFEEPVLGWNLAKRAPAAATLKIDK
jgi:hypothetical protein